MSVDDFDAIELIKSYCEFSNGKTTYSILLTLIYYLKLKIQTVCKLQNL